MHLSTPREGLPPLLDSESAIMQAAEQLERGEGPIAVDTERAADYRYDDRAYLVQLRRPGCGTVLVDPTVSDAANAAIGAVMNNSEWILHAAHTDLPCLTTLGWRPTRMHDTQIAGRLLGMGQPGLGPMLEHFFDITIDKDKGREDWSARPLATDLLTYAALDVELLGELLHTTLEELENLGRTEWYDQDCAAVLSQAAPIPTPTWTDMKGVATLRNPRSLAIARALWTVRNDFALEHDRSPERTLKRKDILRISQYPRQSLAEMRSARMPSAIRRRAQVAVKKALSLPDAALPRPASQRRVGIPDHRHWERDYPRAFAALEVLSSQTNTLAEELGLSTDAIATMKPLRKSAWAVSNVTLKGVDDPVAEFEHTLGDVLESEGARPWQIELISNASVPQLLAQLH